MVATAGLVSEALDTLGSAGVEADARIGDARTMGTGAVATAIALLRADDGVDGVCGPASTTGAAARAADGSDDDDIDDDKGNAGSEADGACASAEERGGGGARLACNSVADSGVEADVAPPHAVCAYRGAEAPALATW